MLTRKMAAIFDSWLGRSRTGEEDWIVRRRRTQLIAWLSRQHPNALPQQRVEVSGERRPALA